MATIPGAYNFTLQVSDGVNPVQQLAFNALTITDLNLKDGYSIPDAFVGSSYSYQLTAFNSSGPLSATFAQCGANQFNLPPGMSLSSSGLLSGAPTVAGNYNIGFLIQFGGVGVCRGVGLNVFAVEFANAVTATGMLPNATQGAPYTYALTASSPGGGPFTFNGCCVPPGLSLSSAGVISGTVTGGPGKYGFNITARDSAGASYSKNLAIDVIAPSGAAEPLPQINPYGHLDDWAIGVAVSRGVGVVGGGTAPFAWNVIGLPAGLYFRTGAGNTLSFIGPGDVEICGTPGPGTIGPHNVTVTVTDANGLTASQVFTIKVSALWVDVGLSNGTMSVPYSQTLRVVGGTGPYVAAELPSNNFPGRLPAGLNLSGLTVSGTPVEGGNFNQLFQFTDSATPTPNTITLTNYAFFAPVLGSSTTVNLYNPIYAHVNNGFSFQLGACCAGGYTWAQTGGMVPPGLVLSTGGLLSGTPTTNGTYTFQVQATDNSNSGNFGTRQITVIITPISINTNFNLPYGNKNSFYNQTLAAAGGIGAISWSLAPGTFLPSGLALSAGGVISGIPQVTGRFNFQVAATDSAGNKQQVGFSLSIYPSGFIPAPSFTSGPNYGTLSLGEDQIPLTATLGNGTYSYSLVGGSLPPGLSIRTDVPNWFPPGAQAGIIGIATTPGNYSFTLQVSSAGGNSTQFATLRITDLNLKDGSLPDAFVGSGYNYQLTAFNTSGQVTATFTGCGSPTPNGLPPGMSLSSAGLLSGTPTATGNYNIGFSFSFGGDTVCRGVNLNVFAVQFTNAVTATGMLPNATQGASYTYALTASSPNGGAFTFNGCCVPPGLSLSSAGVISGTVTGGPGKYGFNVTARDSAGATYNKSLAIDVVAASVAAEPLPQIRPYGHLDDWAIGLSISRGISVCCGGTAPFTWNVGGLPSGLAFRSGSGNTVSFIGPGDVEIWGTPGPGTLGPHNITVTVTDTNGLTTSQVFTMNVSAIWVDNGLPNGTVSVPYSQTFRVVGGTGPYVAAELPSNNFPGRLPAGLNLSGLTVSGTPVEGGNFNQLFQFTDSATPAPNTITLTNYPFFAPVLGSSTTVNLYNPIYAHVNNGFSFQLGACCAGGYTWAQTGGMLPPGLALSTGGLLSGTPTANGTYTFQVQATDNSNSGDFGTRQIIVIVTPIGVNTSFNLPSGEQNILYSQTLVATSSSGTVTWALASGYLLPAGLSLSSGGVISGIPQVAGQFNINVIITDAAGNTQVAGFNLMINPPRRSTGSDFNGDGHPDVIWQDQVSGWAQVWYLGGAQGNAVTGAANLTLSNTWRIVGVADFNGDTQPDVVWQDPVTGAAQVWFLGGAGGNVVNNAVTLSGGNAWRIRAIADFNGDGHPDVIWQDQTSGFAQIWFMGGANGTSFLGAVNLTKTNTWRIAGAADFNLDGQTDVVWQDPVSGAIQIWYLGGAQGNVVVNAVNVTTSNPWVIAAVADFNLDSHPDLVLQDPATGTSALWLLGGTQGATLIGSATFSGPNPWRIMGPR